MTEPSIAFLNSADWFVGDPSHAVARVRELVGFQASSRDLTFQLPTHRFDARFFCAEDPMTVAPTKLEFIDASNKHDYDDEPPNKCDSPPLLAIERLQGSRPQKTHATNIVVENFDETLSWFQERDIPLYIEKECEHLPFQRGWVGWTESGARYIPGFDAGLFIEVIPIEAFPAKMGEAVARSVRGVDGVSRVGARTFLVDDLENAAKILQTTLGIRPDGIASQDAFLGVRKLTFSFRHAGGAQLVLAVPVMDGPARGYFSKWGAGLFTTELRFVDPEAIARHASSKGARIEKLTHGEYPRALISDDLELPGVVLELNVLAQSENP